MEEESYILRTSNCLGESYWKWYQDQLLTDVCLVVDGADGGRYNFLAAFSWVLY
jgi:hypothetical protein